MKYTNELINEKSPYLQQHAHNPVNWYPWGEKAFAKAKKEDKPIFLSIGYATCHWCHVMEHESFEDEEVAKLMNEAFVCIKVDREERPDIDNVYMTVCQIMTGQGGWPLTIFMTPDKEPFYAGTYFPKTARFGRIGMMELIPKIDDMWKNKRDKIILSASQIKYHLEQLPGVVNGVKGDIDKGIFKRAYQELAESFDKTYGGFGDRPKFPTPHRLLFLLRYWRNTGEPNALAMVEFTLRKMREGGIFDHIGYGFHRYSTDRQWLLPHFEKMLYDQALLAMAYCETYLATKNPLYLKTADEIFSYVIRDMTSEEGGFYSAEDADSDGEEGKFYVWDYNELKSLLTDDEFKTLTQYFDIEPEGNFYDEATREETGKIIIRRKQYPAKNTQAEKDIERIRVKLFAVREKRIHPLKDTKILTDWNGLMIAALAKRSRIPDGNGEKYRVAAEKAAQFINGKLRNSQGELMHRYKDGEVKVNGMCEDYAFFIWGLLELYESTFNIDYLTRAIDLNSIMIEQFHDEKGGFFMTADHSEKLLVRPKEVYDGAIPSGNSAAFLNLMKLFLITGKPEYEEYASGLEKEFAPMVERSPSNCALFLCGAMFADGPSYEIVLVAKPGDPAKQELLNIINAQYLPYKVVLYRDESTQQTIFRIAPYTKDQNLIDDKATLYLCQNRVCRKPLTDSQEIRKCFSELNSE